MKIVVIGVGGVGGYFGARLALAGNRVLFLARGKHLQAIEENGLTVKSTKGEFAINPAMACNDYSVVEVADLILVCTKAWQLEDVAKNIAPYINDETIVLPLQNGVTAADELAKYIPRKNIVGGLCRIFSKIEQPGVINHFGANPTIIFGEFDGETSERTAWLDYTFKMTGLTYSWSNDINADLWKKFLMICSSALLAVTKTTYGELREIPETRNMLEQLFTEVYNVGIAAGINLPSDIVTRTMASVDNFPYDSTSSLTRDILNGKPSEIEYQNGTVVCLGEKYNIPTPVNTFVYHSLLPSEMKARKNILL